MSTIMLIMQRKAILQELIEKIKEYSMASIIYEPDYYKAYFSISKYQANTVLIEAAESGPYDIDYCLALCRYIRKNIPDSSLLLMSSDQDEESIEKVVDAKGKKEIDDFVFYDVTIDYLSSKLISI